MQQRDKFLNYGLFIAATVPIAIALTLCGHSLYIVWPELTAEQAWAMPLGLCLIGVPCLLSAVAALFSLRAGVPLSAKTITALALALVACFYSFLNFIEPHVAFRDWLFDHDAYLTTVISGLIPLFYYLLFCLASALAITTTRGLILSIVTTVVLPVAAYLGSHVIRLMPNFGESKHLWQIGALALTSAFSFFILRLMIYILARNAGSLTRGGVFWALQFFLVGLLPFLGLALNARGPVARESQAVLGDFTSLDFWVLALINGLLYVIPSVKYYPLAFALLALRTAGFIFVLYFCTVFILFLPLALILIAAIGLGFLLLIPYAAAAVQIVRLRFEYLSLVADGRKTLAITALVVGAALLPTATLGHIYLDRMQLSAAIRFIEQPPLELNHRSGIDAEKVLALAAAAPAPTNRGRGWGRKERNIPIYDALYRQIVFEGAELSEVLRKRIRWVFAGVHEFVTPTPSRLPQAELGKVSVTATAQGALTQSTLRVTVANNRLRGDAEFSGTIELPDGAFITGHWLTIDGVEVPAQITNRNTAIWVYNRVTEARRDPSLIYYETKNTLRWRIFPVPESGTREARLTITHAGDTDIRIAGKNLSLKGQSQGLALGSRSGKVNLVAPASEEEIIRRKPYLHFIADCSKNGKRDYGADIQTAAQELGVSLDSAKISFTNTSLHTTYLSGAPASCPVLAEGFFADGAVKAILYSQFQETEAKYPVLVVLSTERLTLNNADLTHAAAVYGDADGLAHFDGKRWQTYRFHSGEIFAGKPLLNLPMRLYAGRYFAANQRLVFPVAAPESVAVDNLEGIERFYDFYWGKTIHRAPAVLAAIETGTLNPATGSIVLETEAQRRKLVELHKKLLNARHQLDAGEQPRMSEPWSFLVIGLVLFIFLLWRRRKAEQAKIAWFDEEI